MEWMNITQIFTVKTRYGGSCFPKDTKAIVDIANKYGEEMFVIKAIEANENKKKDGR